MVGDWVFFGRDEPVEEPVVIEQVFFVRTGLGTRVVETVAVVRPVVEAGL